jgi:hypothetical protein
MSGCYLYCTAHRMKQYVQCRDECHGTVITLENVVPATDHEILTNE